MISKSMFTFASIIIASPVLTGIGSSLVAKYGHTFGLIAKTGLLHAGIIGTVQALAGMFLTGIILNAVENTKWDNKIVAVVAWVASHVFVGAVLFAISLLAVKVGIISTGITLTAAALLTLANCASSAGLFSGFIGLTNLLYKPKAPRRVPFEGGLV